MKTLVDRPTLRSTAHVTLVGTAMLTALVLVSAVNADELIAPRADIREAINRGREFMKSEFTKSDFPPNYRELIAYSLLKSGGSESDPIIKEVINDIVKEVAEGGFDVPPQGERNYEVGLQAMILADAGGEKYFEELEVIRDFLIRYQNDDGSWSYSKNGGADLSVTQYAILGLWAAERAGAKVPKDVWGRSAKFFVKAQRDDGGFPYQAWRAGNPTMNMTAAALGSMAITRMHLPKGGGSSDRRKEPDAPTAVVGGEEEATDITAELVVRYGIFRPVDEEAERLAEEARLAEANAPPVEEEPDAADRADETTVRAGSMDGPIGRATGWLNQRFGVKNDLPRHLSYWYYTLERAASLTDRTEMGGQDWYTVCADFLLTEQASDGHWLVSTQYPKAGDTAFVVLFLSRPTQKYSKAKPPADRLGGGLLAGGRGLPSDLSEYGKPVEKVRKKTALESMLSDLSEADATELPDLQERLVEEIQIADRNELIGQTETLIKLVNHRNPEIRRTVLWAIGRTGDLRLARYPLSALDDASVSVLTEARNALAWIARTPDAKGFPENPMEGVPAGAPSEERTAAVEKWRDGMWETWGRWYLEQSPYATRFDEYELDLRARLGRR